MDCPICNELFDSKDHIPMVGACGHSVCIRCVSRNCPLCRENAAFALGKRRRNYQLIAVIEELEFRDNLQKNKATSSSTELSSMSIEKCTSCKTVVEEKKLRICVYCLSESERDLLAQEQPLDSYFIEKMDKSVLCGSCFLEGPHEGHASLVWLPVKLRLSAAAFTRVLQDRGESCQLHAKRDLQGLITSIESLNQAFERLGEKAKQCESVAQYKELVEKGKKEMEAVDEVQEGLASQMKQHSTKIEALKNSLEGLIESDPFE